MSTMLVAFGPLVGCSTSTEETAYDVPKELCGVSVDQHLISSFLPSGKEIDVQEKNPVPSRKRCQVNIDGKVALVASQEWWEKGDSITTSPMAPAMKKLITRYTTEVERSNACG